MKDFLSKNWKVITIIVVGVIVAYASVVFLGKDNQIEQDVEKVIETETGIKIDLTP